MYQQNPSTFHFLSARDSAYTWGIWTVIFLLLALSTAVPVSYQWIYTLIALLACAFLLGILYRTRYELRAADPARLLRLLAKNHFIYAHTAGFRVYKSPSFLRPFCAACSDYLPGTKRKRANALCFAGGL